MADLYFEAIMEEVEELQNNGSDIIVEYSVRLFSHSLYPSLLLEGVFAPSHSLEESSLVFCSSLFLPYLYIKPD